MSKKQSKRVYSKPTKVIKPKEEKIDEQVEEVVEVRPIDPEVFETKLFVEEEPEQLTVQEINEELHETHQNFDAVAEIEKAIHAEIGGESYGIDAEAEINKELQQPEFTFDCLKEEIHLPACDSASGVEAEIETLPEPEKEIELVKGNELTEKLKEIQTKIEEFQTIQVVPASPEPELIYTLTKEQEEEGAKAVADMVNNSILEDLKELGKEDVTEKIHGEYFFTEKQAHEEIKAISPEPLKDKELDNLSNAELRHFRRTGQMPK